MVLVNYNNLLRTTNTLEMLVLLIVFYLTSNFDKTILYQHACSDFDKFLVDPGATFLSENVILTISLNLTLSISYP